jgi:hypothetical protein
MESGASLLSAARLRRERPSSLVPVLSFDSNKGQAGQLCCGLLKIGEGGKERWAQRGI